jgi:hypothetical protein
MFFASGLIESLFTKILPVGHTDRSPVHKTHSSALTVHRVHLATAHVGIKECVVTKEFCKHSLPVVSAWNLLNYFHI